MANEGMTKPTYSELVAENLRVRGLLQRLHGDVAFLLSCVKCGEDIDIPTEEAIRGRLSEVADGGAESADIGKLDAVDEGSDEEYARYEQYLYGWKAHEAKHNMMTFSGWAREERKLASAETGGEKAAPQHCLVTGNICGTDTWGNGYSCLCKNCQRWLATFRSSSQNQAVSGGVEGAHEGTTADKSGSREPEKLWCPECCTESGKTEYGNCDNNFHKSLAEPSLSSPPPIGDQMITCKRCGKKMHRSTMNHCDVCPGRKRG